MGISRGLFMITKYLLRERQNLEDGYIGRPVDIIDITEDFVEAKSKYVENVLADLENLEIEKNLDKNFLDERSKKSALELAHQYAMQKENHALLDESGYIASDYGFPEELTNDCILEIAEMLGVSPLQLDILDSSLYVIYFPQIQSYLHYLDEFPNENFATVVRDNELAFGHQKDFIVTDKRPISHTQQLLNAFFAKIPIKIEAKNIDKITNYPNKLRNFASKYQEIFLLDENENGVILEKKSTYGDKKDLYYKFVELNSLLQAPLFVEKLINPDELIELYIASLQAIADYYEMIYGDEKEISETIIDTQPHLSEYELLQNSNWEALKSVLPQRQAGAYVTLDNIFTIKIPIINSGDHQLMPLEFATWLVKEQNVDINKTSKFGDYPLYTQIDIGNTPVVKLLLDNGANPNIEIRGTSALFWAIARRNIEVVRLMLEHNADLHYQGSALWRALSGVNDGVNSFSNLTFLTKYGNDYLDIVELILSFDSNIDESSEAKLHEIQENLLHLDSFDKDSRAYPSNLDWDTYKDIRQRLHSLFSNIISDIPSSF